MKAVAANSDPAANGRTGPSVRLVAMMAGVMVVTVVAFAALLLGLVHGMAWQECALLVAGAALLAGGISYTIQRFRNSSIEGSTKGGEI